MIIEGEYQIPSQIENVWQALNDPEVLKHCIAGCEHIEQMDENKYECLIIARYGPVKTKFKTIIEVSNINAPHSYTLSGQGKGGIAGFGKGKADVQLTKTDEMTLLQYQADFSVGGKLAQVGSRLVLTTTKKLSDDFFSRFSGTLAA